MNNLLSRWIKSFDPYHPDNINRRCDGIEPIVIETSRTQSRLYKIMMIMFTVFMVWALLAPIDNGVHVYGTVVIQGNRKVIQHPQGGVIEHIMVKEGSFVNQGDTLIRINPLDLQAQLNALDLDYINAMVTESRLLSERIGRNDIDWPESLESYGNPPKVQEAKLIQHQILRSRQQELKSKISILNQQISSYEGRIQELTPVMALRKEQLISLADEVKSLLQLATEGFIPLSRANEMERIRGDLIANVSSLSNDIAAARSGLLAARLQIDQENSTYLKDVDSQLSDAQRSRRELQANVDSMRFKLNLTEIKAPVSGTVMGMKVFTEGGVIQGGQTLLEIVPAGHDLIIEAKVHPDLIDKVRVGLESDIRFTAFNKDSTPVIPARVILVGVDKLLKSANDDFATPSEYYIAHLEITQKGREKIASNQIQAGMTTDVVIKTGERTFMSYLMKPIADRVALSFKDN